MGFSNFIKNTKWIEHNNEMGKQEYKGLHRNIDSSANSAQSGCTLTCLPAYRYVEGKVLSLCFVPKFKFSILFKIQPRVGIQVYVYTCMHATDVCSDFIFALQAYVCMQLYW